MVYRVVKRKSVKLGCPYVYVIALCAYVVLYGVDVRVSTPRSSCFHELNHDIMNYFAASVAGPESTPVIAQSDR